MSSDKGLLQRVTAMALVATVGATVAQLSKSPGALSVFMLGLVQGLLFLLLTNSSPTSSPSPLAADAIASPLKSAWHAPPSPATVDEAASQDAVTPRSLLKNISAVETKVSTAVVPRSTLPRSTNVEVEYTLEEYETLKKQKRQQQQQQQQSQKSTPLKLKGEKEPDSGVPSRRKSLRTPKASSRYASDY